MVAKRTSKQQGEARSETTLGPFGVAVALLSISLVMVVFALPTFLIVVFGLAPTWVAFLTDRGYGWARSFAIGTFNLAGATPFFIRLWRTPDQMEASLEVLSNVYSWLIMYGTASFALLLVWIAPSFSTAVLEFRAAAKSVRLGRRQSEIIENWGEEIRERAREVLVEHGHLRADERLGPTTDPEAQSPISF